MTERRRRFAVAICIALTILGGSVYSGVVQPQLDKNTNSNPSKTTEQTATTSPTNQPSATKSDLAAAALQTLAIKGRAPKTGYARDQFGEGWATISGCSVRNLILQRDLKDIVLDASNNCSVESGTLHDPYTNKAISFKRGPGTSDDVQIDHIVALSDAWQKGAQQISPQQRKSLANDPLNLMSVDGPANQTKGDGDAATWLPPNKAYRCRYVARQIAVKAKYQLWVTQAEHEAMAKVLATCPEQVLPIVDGP